MRKTKIHKLLTQISQSAKHMRNLSDTKPMFCYNELKASLLQTVDEINKLCSEVQDEVFS